MMYPESHVILAETNFGDVQTRNVTFHSPTSI